MKEKNTALSSYIYSIFNIQIERHKVAARKAASRCFQEYYGKKTKWNDLSDGEKDFFIYVLFSPKVLEKDWIGFGLPAEIRKVKNKILQQQLKTPIPAYRAAISDKIEELYKYDYYIENAPDDVIHKAYEQFISDLRRYFLVWIDSSEFHIPAEDEWICDSQKCIDEAKNDPNFKSFPETHGMRICDYLLSYEHEGEVIAHDKSYHEQLVLIEKINTIESILRELNYVIDEDDIYDAISIEYDEPALPFPDINEQYNPQSGISIDEYNAQKKANDKFLEHINLLKHKREHHSFYHKINTK